MVATCKTVYVYIDKKVSRFNYSVEKMMQAYTLMEAAICLNRDKYSVQTSDSREVL